MIISYQIQYYYEMKRKLNTITFVLKLKILYIVLYCIEIFMVVFVSAFTRY